MADVNTVRTAAGARDARRSGVQLNQPAIDERLGTKRRDPRRVAPHGSVVRQRPEPVDRPGSREQDLGARVIQEHAVRAGQAAALHRKHAEVLERPLQRGRRHDPAAPRSQRHASSTADGPAPHERGLDRNVATSGERPIHGQRVEGLIGGEGHRTTAKTNKDSVVTTN